MARFLFLLILASGLGSAQTTTFNGFADFSPTTNPSGRWSYEYNDNLGGPFQFHTSGQPDFVLGVDRWATPAIDHFLMIAKNKTNSPIAGTPNTYAYPVGMLYLHPTLPNWYNIVRWVAPSTGSFLFEGAFAGLDVVTGVADTDVHILHNSTTDLLPPTVLRGVGTQQAFSFTRSVITGDTIDFAVGRGPSGFHNNDSTGLAVTITDTSPPPPPTACGPPTLTTVQDRRHRNLADVRVSDVRLDQNNQRTGTVHVVNRLRFWLGVSKSYSSSPPYPLPTFAPDITAEASSVAAARNDLILPCKTGLSRTPPFFVCTATSTLWTASFCGPGSVDLTLSITGRAAAATLLDGIASVIPGAPATLSPSKTLSIVDDLYALPDYKKAADCLAGRTYPGDFRRSFECTISSLRRLRADSAQLQELAAILARVGISITLEALGRLLLAPIDIGFLLGDSIVLQGLTQFTGKFAVQVKGE